MEDGCSKVLSSRRTVRKWLLRLIGLAESLGSDDTWCNSIPRSEPHARR